MLTLTPMLDIGALLLNGFIFTVELTLVGIFGGLGIGILLAIGDMYGGKVVSGLIRVYVEFFRGSPILVQLFITQWGLPELTKILIDQHGFPGFIQIMMNPYVTGYLVFALNSGAYQKGYIKGAMETVFEDQMLAGLSVGMSKAQTIVNVILPQALRIVIPAWSNEFCSLTKSTSAVALIGGFDLTAVGRTIAGLTYNVIGAYSLVAVVYLVWITAFTKVADIVYERKKIPGIEISV
jgi:polar amino acid transport system permease protein